MNQDNLSNQHIRQSFFIAIIVILGGVIFWQLRSLIPALLGAYTLYILLQRWMKSLTQKLKGRKSIVAIILMLFSFIIVLVPLNALVSMLTARILPTIQQSNDIWHSVEAAVQKLEQRFDIQILTQKNLSSLGQWGIAEVQKLIGGTFNSLFEVLMMYFILYFMLTEGQRIEKAFYKWLPLRDKSVTLLKKHLNSLVISNAIGIPLVAIMQGLVALIGYWITGVPQPFIWFIATCIAGVIPVLGVALVYVPLSILLFANNSPTQGIALFLYCFLLVGSVDNIFRFWLQKKIGDTHPLITLFGIIIGLNLFGFIGLIFGPILISLFLLLMTIYRQEFHTHREEDGGE